jgi:AraC-like DNA-binding protein
MFEDASLSVRRYAPSEVEYIHDWNQVVLPVEGAQDVDFGHTGGTIVAARGVLVPRGQPHMVRTRGDRGQALSMDVWRQAREAPFFRLDAGLRHLLGYVAHDLAEESGDAATAGRMADLVIDALGRRLGRDHRPAGIRRALDLIHARYAEAIPVTELAAVAGLSVSAFNQHFRAAVGRAPCDYRIDLRIDCAARLLAGRRPVDCRDRRGDRLFRPERPDPRHAPAPRHYPCAASRQVLPIRLGLAAGRCRLSNLYKLLAF